MLITVVESTTLSSAAYDPSRQLLWLTFPSGAVYCYFAVPQHIHQELISAPSIGKYFNLNIRGHFDYRKLADLHASMESCQPLCAAECPNSRAGLQAGFLLALDED